ncbi:N alpha-acetyl-transferase, partial [Cryomyces antarcticus]
MPKQRAPSPANDSNLSQSLSRSSSSSSSSSSPTPTASQSKPKSNIITAANALPSSTFRSLYLAPLSLPSTSVSAPSNLTISFSYSSDLSRQDLLACFRLVESTSKEDYAASSRRWKPRAKLREMGEVGMRYLIVRETERTTAPLSPSSSTSSSSAAADNKHTDAADQQTDTPILAFLSFHLLYEDARPVLYVYELHLSAPLRRLGLGTHLLSLAQRIAASVGVAKTMLTVFVSNAGAVRFYERCGFEVDEFSPRGKRLRG